MSYWVKLVGSAEANTFTTIRMASTTAEIIRE